MTYRKEVKLCGGFKVAITGEWESALGGGVMPAVLFVSSQNSMIALNIERDQFSALKAAVLGLEQDYLDRDARP